MPIYEYRCPKNGKVVEVRHRMDEKLATWGELCARADIPLGSCAPSSPVEKLISAGFIAASSAQTRAAPACAGGGCGSGLCGGDL